MDEASGDGHVGDTYVSRLWFQDFARLELGTAGAGQWFVISDPLPWRVEFRFRKVNVTEALWGIDANGDGVLAGNISEADLGIDANGDGDTTDLVGYWDNNGSFSADDNGDLPP